LVRGFVAPVSDSFIKDPTVLEHNEGSAEVGGIKDGFPTFDSKGLVEISIVKDCGKWGGWVPRGTKLG
jgi:hypothetical protein